MARELAAALAGRRRNAGAPLLAGTADAGGAQAAADSGHRDRGPADGGAAHAGASAGARADPRRRRAHRRAQRQPLHRAFAHRGRRTSRTSLADYVLDGGPARVGIESTVLSLAGAPLLLRPGVIPLPEIEALIGPVAAGRRRRPEGRTLRPGCTARHYRPRDAAATCSAPGERAARGPGAWLRIGREMPADPLRIRRGTVRHAAPAGRGGPRLDRRGAPAGQARVGGRAGPAAPGGRGVVAGEGRRKRDIGSDLTD